MSIELQQGQLCYVSGTWPARGVTVVNAKASNGVLVSQSGKASFEQKSNLHATRLAADEATLVILRAQHANCKERLDLLQAEIDEVESKKGQA